MIDKLIWFLILLIAALAAYGFFTFYERYEEEVNTGWSIEAIQNPYLAAEQFLNENNKQTATDIEFDSLSDMTTSATLFIPYADTAVPSATKIDEVLTWAEAGGHLILGASDETEYSSNTIFDQLGVFLTTEEIDSDIYLDNNQQQTLSRQLEEINEKGLQALETLDDNWVGDSVSIAITNNEEIEVTLPLWKRFGIYEDHALNIVTISENEWGIYFLQIQYGSGLITLLPDSELWESYEIGYLDNAYFLLTLVDNEHFMILARGQMPSLMNLLNTYAVELMVSSLAWLVFWLWFSAVRRGRLVPLEPVGSRALSDYVVAMSEFFLAGGRQYLLMEAVKQDVFDQLIKKDRHFLDHSKQMQAELIVEYCQPYLTNKPNTSINRERVLQWLKKFEQDTIDELDFVEQVKLSHAIRKRLQEKL